MRNWQAVALTIAALGLAAGPAAAQALNDNTNLKLLKAKSNLLKMKQDEKNKPGAAAGKTGQDFGCGHVDIGNVDRQKGVTGGEVTVVITGDVINTGNKCK